MQKLTSNDIEKINDLLYKKNRYTSFLTALPAFDIRVTFLYPSNGQANFCPISLDDAKYEFSLALKRQLQHEICKITLELRDKYNVEI